VLKNASAGVLIKARMSAIATQRQQTLAKFSIRFSNGFVLTLARVETH
jgi:hypothetical protein